MTRLLHVGVLITILSITFLVTSPVYADTMGSVAVTLRYTNGDTADYWPVSLKIYQDFNTTPYKVIESLSANPFNIVSLPIGHQYKIDTYVNGLYASTSYASLQQSHEDLVILLPLPGGLRLDVFYNDGLTPISGATVYVRSLDNKTWAHSSTDTEGKTLRFWLEPTISEDEHYIVDVKIGDHLVYSQSQVRLNTGIAHEVKITSNWPPIVNSVVTVRVLDEKQNPLVSNDMYVVSMFSNGSKISESKLSSRGEAYFSNIKVGDYQFKAIKTSDISEWGNLNVTIDGIKTTFDILKNQPPQATPQVPPQATPQVPPQATPQVPPQSTPQVPPQATPQVPPQPTVSGCNCVAFRLDNIQDYWLDDVQSKIIDTFDQKGASITIGIIGNAFGSDSKLIEHIKARTQAGSVDIATNGWNFEDFTTFDQSQQQQLLEQSKNKLFSFLGVTPSVFIPPYGKVNNNTFFAMSNIGINFLSTTPDVISPSNLASIRNLPAKVNAAYPIYQNRTNDAILSDIKNAINKDGFAIVTLNFQDYAQNNGTIKINIPDPQKIQNLQSLIDSIKSSGYSIVNIKDIAKPPSIPEFGPIIGIIITISLIGSLIISRRFSSKI